MGAEDKARVETVAQENLTIHSRGAHADLRKVGHVLTLWFMYVIRSNFAEQDTTDAPDPLWGLLLFVPYASDL